MYAIVDIETTGGSPLSEKVTEVAIYIHNGVSVVDQYVTLINPEKNIPYYITGLTGITNEMVANAPRFYEVAKKIVEITNNCVFVAHNATFDYNFIKSEFRSLGFNYQRETLCTVKLSRKLIPGKHSYSLGNLCTDLGIVINDRHRAAGDALATVKLFEILLSIKNMNGASTFAPDDFGMLHPSLQKEKVKTIPDEPGVYYFHNEKHDLIYIGKSRNMNARIMSHLGPTKNRTALKMRKEIADVSYEHTGSELIALLLESAEIKKHKPLYNKAQRRTLNNYGIFSFTNEAGYLCFDVSATNETPNTFICTFENRAEARQTLLNLCEKYTLCQKYCGLYNSAGSCFHYEIRQCNGACMGTESAPVYNQRAHMALNAIARPNSSFLIVDKGRHNDEKSVVRIVQGKYIGFGYIDTAAVSGLDALAECIKPQKDNHEVWQIIISYLSKNKVEKIINY